MATKPPPAVDEFTPESLEKIAYSLVSDLDAREPNDRNRLGFDLWAWLRERKGTLEEVVRASGFRSREDENHVVAHIRRLMTERGIQ